MEIEENHEMTIVPDGFDQQEFINIDFNAENPFSTIGINDYYNVDQFNNLIAAMQKAVEKYEVHQALGEAIAEVE